MLNIIRSVCIKLNLLLNIKIENRCNLLRVVLGISPSGIMNGPPPLPSTFSNSSSGNSCSNPDDSCSVVMSTDLVVDRSPSCGCDDQTSSDRLVTATKSNGLINKRGD
jgi:hypothetical protein